MNKERTNKLLFSNMVSNGLFQILMILIPLITTPYISRIFNPSQIGIFATTYSFVSFFVVLASFGIPVYGSRLIAQSKNKIDRSENFFELWFIQLLTSSFLFILVNIFAFLLFKNMKYYIFLQSFLLLINIFDISWFFIGIEEIRKNIIRNFVSKIFATCLIFIFVKNEDHLSLYIIFNCLGMFLGNLTMIFQVLKYIEFKGIKKRLKKLTILNSFRLLIPVSVETGKNSASRWILLYLSNAFQAGIFDQGMKIISMLTAIVTSMANAVAPRMSYMVSIGQKKDLGNFFFKFLKYIDYFSIILMIGMNCTSTSFVRIFFGSGYEDVETILRVGSFSIILYTINQFLCKGFLIPLAMDREYIKVTTYSALLLLLSNILLVRNFGAEGSIFAFLFASIITLLTSMMYLKNIINPKTIIKHLFICYLMTFIGIIIVTRIVENYMLSNYFWSFIAVGLTSVIVGLILCILIHLFIRGIKNVK